MADRRKFVNSYFQQGLISPMKTSNTPWVGLKPVKSLDSGSVE